jgi:hypothetical protein
MSEPNLPLREATIRCNLSLIQQMSASSNQNHTALAEIAANNQSLLKDCSEHITASGLTFEAAITQLENRWTELLCVVDGTTGEGESFQPTYSLLRSDGDVNICAESLQRFNRFCACSGQSLPVWAYVATMHGYNSLIQMEAFLRAAGHETNLAPCLETVLLVEGNLARGASFASVLQGFESELATQEANQRRINTKVVIDIASGEVESRESYNYSGPVAECCGPSSSLKALNTSVQGLLSSAKSQATAVFGSASTVFNNIMNSVQGIVAGGPSQAGFSESERSAMDAAAVQNGATLSRNAGAVAATEAAIGGGNTVTPAGGTQNAVLQAKIAAGEQTSEQLSQIEQADFAQGNANYERAVDQEMKLPSVFDASTAATGAATNAAKEAGSVQQEMDKQSNWWQPMISSAIGGVTGMLTGGLMGGSGRPQQTMSPGGWANDMQTAAASGPVPTTTSTLPNQIG